LVFKQPPELFALVLHEPSFPLDYGSPTFLSFARMRIPIAVVLVSAMIFPRPASASPAAALTGRVLPPPPGTPVATRVWIGPVAAPVAPDGTFRAEGLPAGPAELAIETPAGMYVVATPVTLAPGVNRSVQLAFGGRQDTSPPPPAENDKKKKKSGGAWANAGTATLIVIGSAIVVGIALDTLTKSSSTPASPSTP
jgi:hypothetical protein